MPHDYTVSSVHEVLNRAWRKPFRIQSDFAREMSVYVALAASDGFITSRVACGLYGRDWHITAAGLAYLEALNGTHDSDVSPELETDEELAQAAFGYVPVMPEPDFDTIVRDIMKGRTIVPAFSSAPRRRAA